MAIANIVGFEAQEANAGSTGQGIEWRESSGGSQVQIDTTTFRGGAASLRVVTTGGTDVGWVEIGDQTYTQFGGQAGEVRFYFRYASSLANEEPFFAIYASTGDVSIELRLQSDDTVDLVDSAGTRFSGTETLGSGAWHRINVTLDAQGGATSTDCIVRINDVEDINETNTVDSGSTTPTDYARFGKTVNVSSVTVDFNYDDILLDGSDTNYPLPAGECTLMLPDGNGTNVAWDSGSTAWQALDDTPPHDTTTTILSESDNPNRQDAAQESAADAGITGTVNAVKTLCVTRKSSNAALNRTAFLRSASSDASTNSGDHDANGVFESTSTVEELDPATSSAWLLSALDSIQCGVRHDQSQTRQMDWTAGWIMVDHEVVAAGGRPNFQTLLGVS